MIDLKQQKSSTPIFDVVILGAGLSGVLAALELSPSLNIALIDIGDEIIHRRSTSYNQCNKLHLGLHYAGDSETAMKCLESSISFASKYKSYLLGKPEDPWRKGRHFVMSNSRFDAQAIHNICISLSDMYRREAKKCQFVFGSPNNFIRYLKPCEYPNIAKSISSHNENGVLVNSSVTLGIETSESQIDINSFKNDISAKIKASQNIVFFPGHQINQVNFDAKNLSYEILTTHTQTSENIIFHGQTVINSTWNNIENLENYIDQGSKNNDELIVRVKASVIVKLPPSIQYLNTCIFSIGPFCSFTNLGNGTAIVTEETVSNLDYYPAGGEVNSELRSLIDAKSRLNHSLGKKLSNDIICKASLYIPALTQSTVLDLQIGYVKTFTKGRDYSIYSAESPIHTRFESGIKQKALGYISAAGMKMTYTYSNAVIISELLREHFLLRRTLITILSKASKHVQEKMPITLSQQKKFIDLFMNYLSFQTGIETSRLTELLPSWQLASIVQVFPALLENHAILSPELLHAA